MAWSAARLKRRLEPEHPIPRERLTSLEDKSVVGPLPLPSSSKPPEERDLKAEEWLFGSMKREEAEKLLMQPFNFHGSFMVRDSEITPGDFTLSIRWEEKVKHYRIRRLENKNFFVVRRVTFETLQDLVAYYSQQADGLPVNLKQPCQTSRKPKTTAEWEIDKCQIRLVRKLGEGQFAEVWEGRWNKATPVAVKTLKPGTMSPQDFLQVAEFMKKLDHPNVVQLYAVCTKEEPVYIVMELMKHGRLLEYLKGEGRSLKLPQLIDTCTQVASGMAYFEKQNYIHRDLSARNILVGDGMICKVAGFSLARVLDEDVYVPPGGEKIPIKWTAPEASLYNRFTMKSDIWSFGIVIYEIITHGQTPYAGMSNADVVSKTEQGYRMPPPPGCPDKLYNIILDCWKQEPADRPTFEFLQWMLEEFFND